jgi:hypothetical protein
VCGGFSIIVDECRVSYPHLTSAKDVICSDAYINVIQYTNCFRSLKMISYLPKLSVGIFWEVKYV